MCFVLYIFFWLLSGFHSPFSLKKIERLQYGFFSPVAKFKVVIHRINLLSLFFLLEFLVKGTV